VVILSWTMHAASLTDLGGCSAYKTWGGMGSTPKGRNVVSRKYLLGGQHLRL